MTPAALARVLADALLAAGPTPAEIAAQAAETLGRHWRFLTPLSQRFALLQADTPTRLRHRDAVAFLRADPGFQRHACRLKIAHWLHDPPQMRPVPAASHWDLPAIETAGALARWLEIPAADLDWFAAARVDHYHSRHIGARLIEAPKPRLKALQRRILTGILNRIPAHPAAHGFLKARSIATFAAPHTAQPAVLKMDLTRFFNSIPAARIEAFFRTAGYPDTVANLLAALCTHNRHLPQGAPTSPALANFIAYRLDARLAGLARAANAHYTRYADDLAFSGDTDFNRFSTQVAAIAHEEGFEVNHRKTRLMHQGVRQYLAGLTANSKVNIVRADFDILKATLTNALRHGLDSQNRENHPAFRAHLEGRVAFMESINPAKARRLRGLLNRIEQ
jgi:hypothetical protein